MSIPILTLKLQTERDLVPARQRSRLIAAQFGFDTQEQTRIATAVSEIARNALRYANGGMVEFLVVDSGLLIRIIDKGPGIRNLNTILEGRYRSETGMGLGIVGAQRLMDYFHVETVVGQGSTITMRKDMPKRAPVTPQEVARIAAELSRSLKDDPYSENDLQSRELLQTLNDLRRRQDELAQLNRELEDTNRGVVALYAELDEKAEHLKQADRLKSTFLSHMSHEFRTPLNSIMALSKILLERLDGPLTNEQSKQVSFIYNAAQELTDMVNDLLDIAKVEAGKIEIHGSEFHPSTLLGTLRGMMRPLLTNLQVQLIFEDCNPLTPLMFSDEAKVAQILRNFVSNAIKFTDSGEIRVTCSFDTAWDTYTFAVSDTGPGIPPEEQERIFQQYYQIDSPRQRKVKGTGLGLPLSKKLSELLGGTIHLRSETGAGSTFSIRLPRCISKPVDFVEADSKQPATILKNRSIPLILVIDDEESSRYVVHRLIAELPADVQEARSAKEGLEILRKQPVDLIVLDLSMPDVSGFYVLSALQSAPETRSIPVVIHTSKTLTEAERAELAHARAIVSKSRTEPELSAVVKSLVATAR